MIEKILDHDDDKGKTEYYVKWKSLFLDQSTWEFESSLTTDEDKAKIEEYKRTIVTRINQSKMAATSVLSMKNKKIEVPPLSDPNFQLRDYQVEGFRWLTFSWYKNRNCLLADEMGLGKTAQTITFLQYLRVTHNIYGPFLIVVPLSTLEHWTREIQRYTGMFCQSFYGTQDERRVIKDHLWYVRDTNGNKFKNVYKFEVVVTTYDVLLLESTTLAGPDWRCLVMDEGHRVKNSDSKTLEKLNKIKARHKIILTGTPVQNNTKELWTLLNILDPVKFKSPDEFLSQFGELKEGDQVMELRKTLAPYFLRRMKEDVDNTIPAKEETIIEI